MVGFWLIWPFETLKNMAQADLASNKLNAVQRYLKVIRIHGFLTLYRGIIPGSQSVFLRNGAAMIMM